MKPRSQHPGRRAVIVTSALALIPQGASLVERDTAELLRDLYVVRRHSQVEIAPGHGRAA